jgi:hypothetical protein
MRSFELTNFNDDTSLYASIAVANDPFAVTAERVTEAPPMLADEAAAFFNPEPRPAIIAWPGYVNTWGDGRAFYMDENGRWRDTVTNQIWKEQPHE